MLSELASELGHFKEGEIIFLNSDISTIIPLLEKMTPKLIIPVVPVHLLLVIIHDLLEKKSIKLIPDTILTNNFEKIMNPELLLGAYKEEGVIYLSHARANEVCPDNCWGPPNYCPHFKREKSITITRYLKDLFQVEGVFKADKNDNSLFFIIVESEQLMPGLGGISGEEIQNMLSTLEKNVNEIKAGSHFVIATSCNCHGVIHFMKVA